MLSVKKRRPLQQNKIKNIIIIILTAVILIETVAFAAVGILKKPAAAEKEEAAINLNISLEGVGSEITTTISSLLENFTTSFS